MSFPKALKRSPLLVPLRRLVRPLSVPPPRGSDPSILDHTAKVRYKLAYDRRPILTQWADKVAVRDYVRGKIGDRYLNEVYQCVKRAEEIDFAKLPREFALKPNHGSGVGIFVHEGADPANNLPSNPKGIVWGDKFYIHPDHLDVEAARRIAAHWLTMRYETYNSWFEWAYKDITAKLLVEKYIKDKSGNPPTNYLFYTFHGEVKYIVIFNVFTGYIAMVTPQWEYMDVKSVTWSLAPKELIPKKPSNLEEMLDIAVTLSDGIDFVRVDLYSDGEKIIFGEMTNYPAAGRSPAYSKEFDSQAGTYWKHFDGY